MKTAGGRAREPSIAATTAALYFAFFFLSGLVTVPSFTLLYLPVILLGVIPIWFGRSGLVGSTIGAFLGGAFVEGLGALGVVESATAVIIYALNWFLIPRIGIGRATTTKRGLALLLITYAFSLFVGTSYILLQDASLRIISYALAELVILPTFALNYVIQAVFCPPLIRILTPRLAFVERAALGSCSE